MIDAKRVKRAVREILRTNFNATFTSEEEALQFVVDMDSLGKMDLCWELEEELDADIDIDFVDLTGMTDVDKAVAHFIKALS